MKAHRIFAWITVLGFAMTMVTGYKPRKRKKARVEVEE